MKRWLLGLVTTFLISACIVSDTPLQQDFDQAKRRLAVLQTPSIPSGGVHYDTGLYVPPLAPQIADLPSWSPQQVHVAAQGLSAGSLLQQVLQPRRVRATFAEPALAEQVIYLNSTGSL